MQNCLEFSFCFLYRQIFHFIRQFNRRLQPGSTFLGIILITLKIGDPSFSFSYWCLGVFFFCPVLQVTVKLYKRGSQGWLGKSLNATTTIPSNTSVIFRISGEEADAKIPANTIHSITLSVWRDVWKRTSQHGTLERKEVPKGKLLSMQIWLYTVAT